MFFRINSFTFLFFTIFVFSFSTICLPQASYLDSLDSRFALQFQITRDFQLTDFQGTIFSGKYHFSRRDAIRLGLSLNFGDSEHKSDYSGIDSVFLNNFNGDENRFSITINSQYIRYFSLAENIALFGGVGPAFTFRSRDEELKKSEDGTVEFRNTNSTEYSIGCDIILGGEWWFHKQLSLSAEYGANFSYSSFEGEANSDEVEGKTDASSFNISGDNVRFGITVYF